MKRVKTGRKHQTLGTACTKAQWQGIAWILLVIANKRKFSEAGIQREQSALGKMSPGQAMGSFVSQVGLWSLS